LPFLISTTGLSADTGRLIATVVKQFTHEYPAGFLHGIQASNT
jgi:hypothetical protein